jgi:leucyl-tRNA synthetase
VDVQCDAHGVPVSATLRSDGKPVEWEGMRTMSKSKGNGVDPTDLVARYGADSIRVFMMFKAPPEDTLEWSDDGVEGSARFLRRLWRMVWEHLEKGPLASAPRQELIALSPAQREIRRMSHATLVKVTDDYGRRRVFNTAIAAVMELMNALQKFDDVSEQGRAVRHEALQLIVQMLAPIAPHICHDLWRQLGHKDALIDHPWPQPDPQALVQDRIEVVVQVNGKLRAKVEVGADASKDEISAAALADATIQKWIEGKPVRKVIVPPGNKLVNVVV